MTENFKNSNLQKLKISPQKNKVLASEKSPINSYAKFVSDKKINSEIKMANSDNFCNSIKGLRNYSIKFK